MLERPPISFGKIALRVGVVESEDLEKARATRDAEGGDLETILIAQGALTPELSELVREAFLSACAVCEQCGRRTDTEESGDHACRCGGTFVAIGEEDLALNPALLASEEVDPEEELAAEDVPEAQEDAPDED